MLLGGLPYKTKQFFFVLIKLSIVVGAFYFIYQKLVNNTDLDFNEFIQFLSKNGAFSTKNILFLLILTFFNWFFEILKWQYLVSVLKSISLKKSLEQSLGALTASLITPNRIGEYGAKAMYYPVNKRGKIMLLNLVGHMTQMSITLVFGCIGLAFFSTTYNLEIDLYKVSRVFIIFIAASLLFFFGIKQKRFKLRGKSIEDVIKFIRELPRKLIGQTFMFSIIRYLIFSFQFYVLLTLFGVEVYYSNAMIVITSMYLISSIIPSIFIFDVVIKGSVAVYLFTIVGVNEFTILSVISIMWILNFVLPSIVGSYFVIRFNLSKHHSK